MNKIYFLFVVLIITFLAVPLKENKVFAAQEPYAKITKPNTAFYTTPAYGDDNIKFILEQSYFVRLLEDEENGYYKAEYMDEIGYVNKSDLTFVKGTPSNPYPQNISFRIFSLIGLNMRTSPIESEGPFNIITAIPFLENNLKYYGKAKGEEVISQKGDIWYYAKYMKVDQSQPKGYLYSVFCDLLTVIPINTEELPVIAAPIFEVENIAPSGLTTLPKHLQIIIVLAVSLPCIVIIYFLFKPTKISIDNGKNKKKKIKKLKKSDYYEFEDL